MIDRLILRHATSPLTIKVRTGMDALKTKLGDIVLLTDTNSNFNKKICEVVGIEKNFSTPPYDIVLTLNDLNTTEGKYAFLGSSADEGDGISPQTSEWDSADDTDKDFCYLSTTDAEVDPRYYIW